MIISTSLGDILLKVAVVYAAMIIVNFLFTILGACIIWMQHGLMLSKEEISEAMRKNRKKPLFRIASFWNLLTFFYVQIPLFLYHRYRKHTPHASLFDPQGKWEQQWSLDERRENWIQERQREWQKRNQGD